MARPGAARCAVAALAGALVAAFISHRRGIYYALMTIAFCQIFWFVAVKWHSVTGGEDGLLNLKRVPADLGFVSIPLTDNVALYYFVLVVSVVVTALLWRIVHSPFGRVIQAIRQNETRVAYVGYNVWLYKWLAFVISAALSGLAGALFALAQLGAFPDVMSLHSSGFVVMMTLIGGGLVSLLGTAHRRRRLFRRARRAWRTHVDVVACGTASCSWRSSSRSPKASPGCGNRRGRAAMFARPTTCRRRRPWRSTERMASLEARGLHMRFGDRVVLEDISLVFPDREFTGIMGPNGAGKTTSFNVLTGRYRPSRGTGAARR